MPYLLSRLNEPSTWGGIAVLLTLLGLSSEEAEAVSGALAAIAAALAVILKERGDGGHG